MFEKFKKWRTHISVLSTIFGIVSGAFGIWAFVVPQKSALIWYSVKGAPVYVPTFFSQEILSSHYKEFAGSQIVESTIVIWSAGLDTVSSEDIRRPLNLRSADQSAKIILAMLVATKSDLEPNFSIEHIKDGSINFLWKKFDPGMAVKLTLLHTGSSKDLVLVGSLGPKYEVGDVDQSTRKAIVLPIIAFMFLILTLVSTFSLSEYFDGFISARVRRFSTAAYVFSLIAAVGISIGGFFVVMLVMGRLLLPVPPIL
jgi:hypothetical protein